MRRHIAVIWLFSAAFNVSECLRISCVIIFWYFAIFFPNVSILVDATVLCHYVFFSYHPCWKSDIGKMYANWDARAKRHVFIYLDFIIIMFHLLCGFLTVLPAKSMSLSNLYLGETWFLYNRLRLLTEFFGVYIYAGSARPHELPSCLSYQ